MTPGPDDQLAFRTMGERATKTPKRKARQERSRALVDALLDATARVLTTRALDRATTNEIAEVAGASVGSLYQYFPNKAALAAALIERKAERDVEELVGALRDATDTTFAGCVATLVRTTVAVHRRDARLMRALLGLVAPTGRAEMVREFAARGRAEVMSQLAPYAGEVREVDLDLAGFVIGRALEEVVHAVLLERPDLFDHPSLESELTHLVVSYLRRG